MKTHIETLVDAIDQLNRTIRRAKIERGTLMRELTRVRKSELEAKR